MKHRKRKVLVVDPSYGDRTSVWMILKEDYVVLTSNDLEEALKIAEQEGVEIVLVGVDRPLFSYRSFFHVLRKAQSRLPFLLLLGEKAWEETIDLPFADWLSKPFAAQSLRQKVQTLLLQKDWAESRANLVALPIPPVRVGEKESFFEAAIRALAHEIKNPLVAVNTFANLLPEKFEDPEFRHQFSRLTGLEVKRINARLENLLEYASLSTPHLSPTHLNPVLLDLLRLEEANLTQRGIRSITELKDALPAIPFDEKHLKFVLHKILEDGLSKIGESKSIRFSTGLSEEGVGDSRKQFVELMIQYQEHPGIIRPTGNTIRTEPEPDFHEWSVALLLARRVMARNHAMMQISGGGGAWTIIRLLFPVGE